MTSDGRLDGDTLLVWCDWLEEAGWGTASTREEVAELASPRGRVVKPEGRVRALGSWAGRRRTWGPADGDGDGHGCGDTAPSPVTLAGDGWGDSRIDYLPGDGDGWGDGGVEWGDGFDGRGPGGGDGYGDGGGDGPRLTGDRKESWDDHD